MKLLPKMTGIAAALLLVSTSASAIVTQWGYQVDSIFTSATYTGSGGTTATLPSTTLTWGIPNTSGGPQSSLSVGGTPATGSVDTFLGTGVPNAPPFLGISTSLTHSNNVIQGNSTSLRTAVLTNTVTLDPILPNNPALPFQIFPFNIAFTETPNSGTCAATSPPNNPCNDIFVLTGGLLNAMFVYDAGDGDGLRQYFVNIYPITGGVLSTLQASACEAAGQAAGCIGFTTEEGRATELQFGFTISTRTLTTEVPEPGILALLGIGLLGMFGLRRKTF